MDELGFALPASYRTSEPEEEPRPRAPRFGRGVRSATASVTLLVAVAVAVGMPLRDARHEQAQVAQRKTDVHYVRKNTAGTLAGTRFVLGSIGPAGSLFTTDLPPGTAGVQAKVYFKSPTKKSSGKLSQLEWVFRDSRGRTWHASSTGGYGSPGKIIKVELQAAVPKDVAREVEPAVRPVRDQKDSHPGQLQGPELVFRRR